MPLPLVGAQAVLAGMPEFNKNADIMNQKIGHIHDKMGGLGGVAQKAGGLVSGAFKAMAVGTAGAVASIGAVGGGILKLAYDASTLPGIESVFKNMTQSMGVDADALMGKMRQATYGAIKDFDLMKSANKAMVGAGEEFGKMFAESLPTLMQVSREAAKAQGVSVEYMYDSIVTGVKRMSPMILDNLGFQLSLTEANEKYAQSIGKTSKELTKQEKQMALLQEVMRAGNQLIDETGGHVDSIQKDVLSWQTAIKNVKDRIGIELLPVLQKFMNLVGKPSQGMQDAIVKVASSFVDKLIPAIDKVAMAVSMLLQGPFALLIRGITSIGTGGLTTLMDTIGAIFSGKNIDTEGFSGLIQKMLTPALGKDMAEKIGSTIAGIATAIQDAIGPIRDAVSDIIDWIRPRLEILAVYFKMAIKGIREAISGEGFETLMNSIKYSLMAVFGIETERRIEKFAGYFKQAADFVVQYSDEIIAALKGMIIVLAGKELIGGFSNLASAARLALGGAGKSILGLLSPMGLLVAGGAILGVAWQKNWFGIQEKTATVIDTIKKIIGGLGAELEGGLFDWNSILPPNLAEVMGTISGVIVGIRDTIQGGDFPWEDVLPPNLSDMAYNVVSAIDGISEAIGPFLSALKDAANWFLQGDFVTGLDTVALAFGEIFGPEVYEGINSFGSTLYNVFTQMGTLISNVFGTILSVAEAVWPNVQSIITTVWDAISSVVSTFITIIWPALLSGFQAVLAWVNDNWPAIQNVIVTVFKIISEVISKVVSEVIPFAVSIFQGLVDWVVQNWPMIQETIQVVMKFIGDIIGAVLSNIQQFWQEHGDNIMSVIKLTWEWIKSTVETVINVIKNIISFVMNIIRGDWKAAWENVKNIINLAWEWIKKTVDVAIKLLGDIIAIGWGIIKTGVETAWDTIKILIENAWDNIKKNVESAIKSVGKILDTELDKIEKAWGKIWDGIATVVKNVWNSILDYVAKGLNGAIDLLNTLIDAANKVPGVDIGLIGHVNVNPYKLAEGGILNRPTFVAGEAGAEVVAPVRSLMRMIQSSLSEVIQELADQGNQRSYSGPQPSVVYNYSGDTYNKVYNLTTQSLVRPGALAVEFAAMELAHA